jgi:phosphoribosylpyrophosphate synthetase
MKHFKDGNNNVYAYESDGSQDSYISDSLIPINDADLAALRVTQAQEAQDALTYAEKRKAAYDLLNQDEMRYDDLINSTTTWQDAIAAIKQEYPK